MEEDRPMTILYLITKSNWGGAQRYVFDLAVEAQRTGHRVLVAFGGEGILARRLKDAGIPTYTLPSLVRDVRIFGDIASFTHIFRLIRHTAPDIVHVNSSKMGGLGALAAGLANTVSHGERLLGRRRTCAHIVFTGHGWTFNEDRSNLSRLLIGLMHFLTIQLADTTIAVSRRTRNQVISLPFVWHKVRVIHNGIGPITLRPREEARQILGIQDTRVRVGIIAELHKNKGLTYALEAWSIIAKQRPDCQIACTIIGDGEEREALMERTASLGIAHMVTWSGYHDDAASLMSAFDIFLLPSITEAFPYVILEAGRAGLPVVSTAVGGIPEVIDDMKSGVLIQPKNPGEIARALLYLYDHPEKRVEFRETLSQRIADRFSLADMIRETFLTYRHPLRQVGKDDA